MIIEDILKILNDNIGIITIILIVVTAAYVYLVYLTLIDMQKSRKAQYIDKKLEKLCSPFLHLIKTFRIDLSSSIRINEIDENKMKVDVCKEEHQDAYKIWLKIIEKYFYFRQDLEKIIPFLHLDAQIEEMFYRSIEGIDDALYIRDFNDWKKLDDQLKCKKINETISRLDYSNIKNKGENLDSIVIETIKKIEYYKLELDKLSGENTKKEKDKELYGTTESYSKKFSGFK